MFICSTTKQTGEPRTWSVRVKAADPVVLDGAQSPTRQPDPGDEAEQRTVVVDEAEQLAELFGELQV